MHPTLCLAIGRIHGRLFVAHDARRSHGTGCRDSAGLSLDVWLNAFAEQTGLTSLNGRSPRSLSDNSAGNRQIVHRVAIRMDPPGTQGRYGARRALHHLLRIRQRWHRGHRGIGCPMSPMIPMLTALLERISRRTPEVVASRIRRAILAPSTMTRILPKAMPRGRYFIPQGR
jgi:hypothetical protein